MKSLKFNIDCVLFCFFLLLSKMTTRTVPRRALGKHKTIKKSYNRNVILSGVKRT